MSPESRGAMQVDGRKQPGKPIRRQFLLPAEPQNSPVQDIQQSEVEILGGDVSPDYSGSLRLLETRFDEARVPFAERQHLCVMGI